MAQDIIIGLSLSHDCTLSVLRDGEHIYTIAEERLSRIKGHIGFPFQALAHVFEAKICEPSHVRAVAVALDSFHEGSNRTLEFILADDVPYYDLQNSKPPAGFEFKTRRFSKTQSAEEVRAAALARLTEIASTHGIDAPVVLVDHHLAHAMSAVCSSAQADPLVITLDGQGDGLSGTVSVLEDERLSRIFSLPDTLSFGNVYSEVTRQLGYKISRHEGKITGLAAFGSSAVGLPLLKEAMWVEAGEAKVRERDTKGAGAGLVRLAKGDSFSGFQGRAKDIAALISHLSPQDQAASVQDWFELCIVEFCAHWLGVSGKATVVLSGGVFANVKLNQRIGALPGCDEIFVFPNMGDGGGALGAAQVALERAQDAPVARAELPHAYWGHEADRAEIEAAFSACSVDLEIQEPADLAQRVAEAIHKGEIVGWFQGRMEMGPRALGNRSIVARPTERHLNEELNRRLSRTEFMPFAPSCLIEERDTVFVVEKPGSVHTAEFMTITYDVRPDWSQKIGAVVHVDNTARPQFVDARQNPGYHAMISAYHALSGLPLVVNTSFNVHEEPIVCRASEGVRALEDGVIDALAIGPFYVTRA